MNCAHNRQPACGDGSACPWLPACACGVQLVLSCWLHWACMLSAGRSEDRG